MMDDNFSEFRLFYELNKDKFPADFRGTVEEFAEWATFYYEVIEACTERMVPLLQKLMFRQYPVLGQAKHPSQLTYIDMINDTLPYSLLLAMRRLLREQREMQVASSKTQVASSKMQGTSSGEQEAAAVYIREKYPKIDEWREFYCKPEEPGTVKDDSRNIYLWPTDEEWEQYKAEQNREMLIFHEWTQKRQKEWYDIVQPLLFEFMPELNDFEPDFWVLYAVTVRDEYESWKDNCEHLENSIEYHLPPESVDWEWEVYKNALREARPKYEEEVLRKRDLRIRAGYKE